MQEPHEGRWSRPRRTGPAAIETLRGGHRVSQHPRPSPREEAPGSRSPSRWGGNPWRGEAQGSSGPVAGTSSWPRYGLPEGARPGSRARTGAEAPGRLSQRHAGKIGPRGPVPLCEGKSSEGPNPTSVRGTKQGRGDRGRRKAPRGRENPAGATNRVRQARSRVGSRDRKRCRGSNPTGGAASERVAAAGSGQTLKGRQGQESSKPAFLSFTGGSGQAKNLEGHRFPARPRRERATHRCATPARKELWRTVEPQERSPRRP